MIRLFITEIDRTSPANRHEAEHRAVTLLLDHALPFRAMIEHHADGSPYIAGHPELHISLSHSPSACVMALSEIPVGVDIESPRPQLARVAHKFLTPEESADLTIGTDTGLDILLHYWTAKESAFKLFRIPGLTVSEIRISPDLSSASSRDRECFISYIPHSCGLIAIASHKSGIEYSLHDIH